jgi:oxygen-independent coproporphyrinogen-3 oxidase
MPPGSAHVPPSASAAVEARPWLTPRAAYLHIPFCRTKCLYCDFNTYAGKERLIPEYVAALAGEIAARSGEASGLPFQTVFFGGGTPSLLAVAQVRRLLGGLRRHHGVAPDAEITVEANPGTFGPDYVQALLDLGVTRISLGIQSLDDQTLRRLARTHSAVQGLDAVRLLKSAGGSSVNLDLIYGLPWQSRAGWQEDLRRALDTEPHHISLYALMVEEGTPLATLVDRGRWSVPDQDAVADMYEAALPILERAGFRHYEVSNWALPGHESRHNLVYWRNEAYAGFGAGAHSYVAGRRWWNVKPIVDYIRRVCAGDSAADGEERLGPAEQLGETAMLALRLRQEGMDFARFRQRFGLDPAVRWRTELHELGSLGLIEVNANRARLSDGALLVSNEIAARFL